MKEQHIQKAIQDFLKLKKFIIFKHRNVGIYKKDTGQYIPLGFGEKGISDLIACAPGGRFWAIEVKQPGGKPSPEQLDFLARVNAYGGKGILAYSIDDVMEAVANEVLPHPAQAPQPSIQVAQIPKPKAKKKSTPSNKV